MSWTVTQLVGQANKRTENRAANKIDVRMEFFLGLDEFVNEQHFWWRKKRGTFTSVIGSQAYDLSATSSATVDGVLIQPGGGVSDFGGQLDSVVLLPPGGFVNPAAGNPSYTELTPIIDPVAQLAALNNDTPDNPSAYFIDPTEGLTILNLQAPSSIAQLMAYTYWAIPQVTDTTIDAIPLVPPPIQWGLVYVLERRLYEFLYGQDDPRWQMSNTRYQDYCKKAARLQHWSDKRVREAAVNGQVIGVVRATG